MFRGKLRIRLMFFEKILRNWPKHPVRIVIWVEGEMQGYGVVSKHSKRVPACRFCTVQAPCPNSQNCLLGRGPPVEASKRETLTACQRTPAFRKRKLGFFDRLLSDCRKSLSLRASPRREASALGVQTGAAIRPTCGQAAIPVCRLIRLFAGTARCRSPAPSSPPWWPRSG